MIKESNSHLISEFLVRMMEAVGEFRVLGGFANASALIEIPLTTPRYAFVLVRPTTSDDEGAIDDISAIEKALKTNGLSNTFNTLFARKPQPLKIRLPS